MAKQPMSRMMRNDQARGCTEIAISNLGAVCHPSTLSHQARVYAAILIFNLSSMEEIPFYEIAIARQPMLRMMRNDQVRVCTEIPVPNLRAVCHPSTLSHQARGYAAMKFFKLSAMEEIPFYESLQTNQCYA